MTTVGAPTLPPHVARTILQPEPHQPRVVVIVPAHNEAKQIGDTLRSLDAQTRPPDSVLVVSDNSTDATVHLAATTLPHRGVAVIETVGNEAKKSGALNAGIRALAASGRTFDYLVTTDADSTLGPDFIETAVAVMEADPGLGGLSGVYRAKAEIETRTPWGRYLVAMQRLEAARARGTRTGAYVHTMSGAAAVYRGAAVEHVIADRGALFDERPSNLVEDYETTLTLKRLGWRCTANHLCATFTDLMPTTRELLAQQTRWTRGTIDELRRHGWRRYTARSIATLATGFGASLVMLALVAYLAVNVTASPRDWLVTAGFSLITPAFSAWFARSAGPRSMLLAVAAVPAIVYTGLRLWWLWSSLYRSLFTPSPEAW